jgi:hypothetical protein
MLRQLQAGMKLMICPGSAIPMTMKNGNALPAVLGNVEWTPVAAY